MAEGMTAVKQWILDQHPDVDDIAEDQDLFESDLLNSLQFVEFMTVIEDAGGVEVDRRELEPEHFRTLNAIRAKFFPSPVGQEGASNVTTAS